MVPYGKLIWTFADKQDRLYFIFGLIASAACGLGLPSFVFLFGDIADSFEGGMDPEEILTRITRVSKILTIIGLGVWLGSYLFFAFLTIASERIGLKTKVEYLRSILRQDIAWFDSVNTSELCQRLSTETQSMQRAIGEKIGLVVMAFGMSLSGLFFSFFKGWFYSSLLLVYFPFFLGASFCIGVSLSRGFSANLKAYGQSAGYAEQALNAIKVVFAFGQEETELRNYVKYLSNAKKIGIKTHLFSAFATGCFYFSLYGYYAYSFFSGSFMIT